MDKEQMTRALERLREYLRIDVAGGFADLDFSAEFHAEFVAEGGEPGSMLPHARRILEEELESHRREAQRWPAITDCDRLDAAFRALRRNGILALHYYGTDEESAGEEIRLHEMPDQRMLGREWRGYVFYTVLDTEGAVEGIGLYLGFGAAVRGAKAAEAIGREVAVELARHGLRVDWPVRWDRRIRADLLWLRRRR